TYFDIKMESKIYHSNIQGVHSAKAIINYILKNGDYISKYKINNLLIAQKVIEKDIGEGGVLNDDDLPIEDIVLQLSNEKLSKQKRDEIFFNSEL
ncbi:4898_t:CDS:2, partial [Dentiscutata heterogama]